MDILKIYKKIYDLSTLHYAETTSFDFFRCCSEKHKFITVCIFNRKGEIFVFRDFNKSIGWELAGGYVQNNEKIEDAVNRIVLEETDLSINELEPISLLENIFSFENSQKKHEGIAFLAFTDGEIKNNYSNVQKMFTSKVPMKMAYQNKKIFKIAMDKIKTKVFDFPYNEVESIRKHYLSHVLHKFIVQKIGKAASIKIKNALRQQIINKPKTILDVSCGDDSLIFKTEKQFKNSLCIANDISWKVISLIRNKYSQSEVIFTNHDIQKLPFKIKFDLIIFKNTLHHIDADRQNEIIQNLSKMSKQLIICDIDDPTKSNYWARCWNWYYVHVMNDCGNNFLNFSEFKKRIICNVKNKSVKFSRIKTIKGYYYYANITDVENRDVENNIEVEMKVQINNVQAKRIREKLKKNNFIEEKEMNEKDIYFTSTSRDFIKSRECLRIRSRDNFAEITYKGKTNADMVNACQFWKKEFNVTIDDTEVVNAECFLQALGFIKVVEVVKKRQKFKLFQTTVSIDVVENGGIFLEVETMICSEDERDKAMKINMDILKMLGLQLIELVDMPYRDIVLNKKFKKK